MKIEKKIKYTEWYLPSKRHRKLRPRKIEDTIELDIPEISEEDAPVAFRVSDCLETTTDYRYFDDKLWVKMYSSEVICGAQGLLSPSELHYRIGISYGNHTKEEVVEACKKDIQNYMLIDGVVYRIIDEPLYVCMTFGLGHNHGGTSLMIHNGYNTNISKDRYFNALQREEAIKYTKEKALKRGDTDDLERIGESYNIEVLIPEAVKCNPQIEHGDGDPFLNALENIAENSSSSAEAGLLTIAYTLIKNKK